MFRLLFWIDSTTHGCLLSLGILIFQRIQSQQQVGFIHALARCVVDKPIRSTDAIPPCSTLHDACAFIEKASNLLQLKNALQAKIINYFYCNSCSAAPVSPQVELKRIFLFKLTPRKEIVAHEVIHLSSDYTVSSGTGCTSCGYMPRPNELQTNICRQIFVVCPPCLIVNIRIIWSSENHPIDDKLLGIPFRDWPIVVSKWKIYSIQQSI